jgi:RNA polymerase sigma-70 factor, ECF subfamily
VLNHPPRYRVLPYVQAATQSNDLVAAAQAGDRDAFSALVRQHQRSVFFVALRLSRGDEQLARDVTQKTFLQAWARRESFRGEASFKTWLLRIASNLSSNELRRAWRHRELVPEEPDAELGRVEATVAQDLERQERRNQLRAAVDDLPSTQRRVALLRLYQDLSFAEIGEALDITANNAKVSFHHAVKKLRAALEPQEVGS